MSVEELPEKIRLLVDHLRGADSESLSLTDVASVTEVLIGTMHRYFRSIDTQIYRECRTLAEYIDNARKEIAALEPDDLESAKIPRAGMELDAIVQHTETATNTIMECAEAIMNADAADAESYKATVEANIVQIFEACSFQDITGQRISKVVSTLSHVEERLNELRALLGVTGEDFDDISRPEETEAAQGDGSAMHGPALKGEGIDQSEVDALFDEKREAASPDSEPVAAEDATKDATEDAAGTTASEESAAADGGSADASASGARAKAPATQTPKPSKTRQDEIDALFG